MKNIAERLAVQQEASAQFRRRNFGLMVGDGYPELVRELLTHEKVSAELLSGFLFSMLRGSQVAEKMPANPADMVSEPGVYEQPTKWLYWGIEIGRQLQREETAAEAVTR